jgi:transketolase
LSIAAGRAEARRLRGDPGHVYSHAGLRDVFHIAKADPDAPSVIIAHTNKGHLGPGRTVLRGAHSGSLSGEELRGALDYLEVES